MTMMGLGTLTKLQASLLHLVDGSRSAALNEQPGHGLQQTLGGSGPGRYLESDADEQIIIQLSFKQKVKLSAILLRTSMSSLPSAPKQVKLFANRPNLDFEDATADEPAQTLELSQSDVEIGGGDEGDAAGGSAIPLRFVKFQDVTSIAIAVLSNMGDETTRIDSFDIFGVASETTNMSDLQKMDAQGRLDGIAGGPPPPSASRIGLKGGSAGRSGRSSVSAGAPSYFSSQPLRSPPATQTQARPPPSPLTRSGSREDVPTTRSRRRNSSASAASAASFVDSDAGSTRTAPPYLSQEDEEEFEADSTSPESFGGWHYLPLIIALAPPLGSVIGGRADAWSDAILLFLSSFWLYQFLRVPWELYYSSRTRRILSHDYADDDEEGFDGVAEEGGGGGELGDISLGVGNGSRLDTSGGESAAARKQRDVEREQVRQAAAAELRRSELMSLLFCIASPLIGAYLLIWIRASMVDGGRYLSALNLRLFTLTAGIKPWSHGIKLVRRRILHLQEEVHYPSSKVEGLNKRMRRLEADLGSIRKMIATKSDIRVLRDVDAQLGRAVRRSEKKEEHLRLSAEDKFHEVENRLEDLLREVATNAELIEEERCERERAASMRISLTDALKFLLGAGLTIRTSGGSSGAGSKHYLYDAPRSLPTTASLGIGSGSPTHEQPMLHGGHPALARHSAYGSQQQQQQQQRGGSPPRAPASSSSISAQGQSQQQQQQQGSSSLDNHMISRYYERNGVGQVSDPWWEQGLAFYLFLPLNVSSAAIRFAGDKMRHIIEDSEEFSLKKQRLRYASIGQQSMSSQQPSPAAAATKMRGQPPPSPPSSSTSSSHLGGLKLMKSAIGGSRARRAE